MSTDQETRASWSSYEGEPPVAEWTLYPTIITDAQAVALARREKRGRLSNKEKLTWVRQTWIPLYRMRTDFTSKTGLRKELRFSSWHQLFDGVSGEPFTLESPEVTPTQVTVLSICPVVPPTEVIDRTVRIWNSYCALDGDKAAERRLEATLIARGVPAAFAHGIDVALDSVMLMPVFVGLLSHPTGIRLVVFDGVDGRSRASVTAAMTSNYRRLMAELDKSRSLSLA